MFLITFIIFIIIKPTQKHFPLITIVINFMMLTFISNFLTIQVISIIFEFPLFFIHNDSYLLQFSYLNIILPFKISLSKLLILLFIYHMLEFIFSI